MKLLLLSDIHGNKKALEAVLKKAEEYPGIEACVLLGDIIDYGMHSNEVIEMVRRCPYPVVCSLYGNHEAAVMHQDYGRFSSARGRESAMYTRSILNDASWDYIRHEMTPSGMAVFECGGRNCLAVHGSLEDAYWKSIEFQKDMEAYGKFDYVFSGHSHIPHFVEKYTACGDARRRNKKKTVFLNPGSVGQPRNLNPMAQFAVLSVEEEKIWFEKAAYDIAGEQSSYGGQVDDFYRERLEWGI